MCFVHSKRSAGCLLCKFHTLSSIFPGLMSFIGKSDIWPCSVKAVLGSLNWTRKWIYDYRYKQFCILKFFHRSKNTCSKSTEKKKQDDTNVLTIAIPSPFNKVLDIVFRMKQYSWLFYSKVGELSLGCLKQAIFICPPKSNFQPIPSSQNNEPNLV